VISSNSVSSGQAQPVTVLSISLVLIRQLQILDSLLCGLDFVQSAPQLRSNARTNTDCPRDSDPRRNARKGVRRSMLELSLAE
jgi:hypothetical protein